MSITAGSPRQTVDQMKLSPKRKSLDAELYGLGRTIRHLQPPGGTENGVFNAYRLPPEVLTPKKKVKDYLSSHVFDVGMPLSPSSRPTTPVSTKTHDHLFPALPSSTPAATHNNLKSTVFDPDPPKRAPVRLIRNNPITGESCKAFDDGVTPKARRVRNPITFEGVPEKRVTSRCTQPPGGRCTFILEYQE